MSDQQITVHSGQTLIIRYVEKALPDIYARGMDEHIAQVHEWFTAEEARIEAKLPGVKVVFVAGDEIAVYDPEPPEGDGGVPATLPGGPDTPSGFPAALGRGEFVMTPHTTHVHVTGSLIAQRDLERHIQQAVLRMGRRNPPGGLTNP